jgi:hypothetical protein
MRILAWTVIWLVGTKVIAVAWCAGRRTPRDPMNGSHIIAAVIELAGLLALSGRVLTWW